ncbi:hypothetical protein E2C01_030019 [Portunus trituberculatus]|uniref:Uncharacterized protein n=1 Tax=Portunus trituberculatus TaxID=210409 RepID=A0A5B7ET33_PORTR|nr:hypothetical protein [Portunus trituberculatus]
MGVLRWSLLPVVGTLSPPTLAALLPDEALCTAILETPETSDIDVKMLAANNLTKLVVIVGKCSPPARHRTEGEAATATLHGHPREYTLQPPAMPRPTPPCTCH